MSEYRPATAAVGHTMKNLIVLEESSISGIGILPDLIREDQPCGRSRLRCGHAHILIFEADESKLYRVRRPLQASQPGSRSPLRL